MDNNTLKISPTKALIIGSGGQDGSYLKELLEARGVLVEGITRNFFDDVRYGEDLTSLDVPSFDQIQNLMKIPYFQKISKNIELSNPDVIYHLAAYHGPSGVIRNSKNDRAMMWLIHVGITAVILETIKRVQLSSRVIVAGSSLMYMPGDVDLYVDENTKANPVNYYAETKLQARVVLQKYKDSYGLSAQMAILFNHESPRRPAGYLASDIAAQFIKAWELGTQVIRVRNPNSRIDVCDARDVITALADMPLFEQSDFVIGSGSAREVRALIMDVARILDLGKIEVEYINHDDSILNSGRYNSIVVANSQHAKNVLGWKQSRDVANTIAEMFQERLNRAG